MSKKTALILIAALTLSACTFMRLASRASHMKQPTITFVDSRFLGANDQQAFMNFNVKAFNPNGLGLKNVTVGYDLFYQNKHFLQGQNIALEFKPKDSTLITVPASVVYREVFAVAGPVAERMLLNRKTIPVRVDVLINGEPTLYTDKEEGGFFGFKLHVSRTVDVPIPDGLLNKAKSLTRGITIKF